MIRNEILEEVIKSQKEWILGLEEGVNREKLLEIELKSSFALVISGIRRCGKSTLLSQILKKYNKIYYLNLEDPRLDGFELKDFNKIDEICKQLYGGEGIYFFDEIQNVLKWEKFVRYLTDRNKKIVITGSNASLLSRELGTKLTGRHLRIELFPFSYKEFLNFFKLKPSQNSFEKFLFEGGFPEFLKKHDPTILHELLNDVIMRDIAVRFKIKNTQILRKIAIYLISNIGKEFSYNSLKKMFEIKSIQTVIDYISYFKDAYVIFTIPKFSYSYRKQQVNPKKVYSIDNGFSHANSVSFSKDKGKMLENSVFLALRRKYNEIFYFQEKGECDFVVKKKEKVNEVIQVCYDLNDENQKREVEGLIEAMKEFNLKTGLILTLNQEDEMIIENYKIKVIPVWKWLLYN
ncbi:ATP-binding protein [Candidatus Pacearchaeota archaeon]|nr:ATP-binding protein [Candidatus Pacearchaeota archaeon]